ncbi:hypothetical protein BGX24_003850 [Mortierella sp. AD032]|nr:hypothetical protein BGX24_003850 [Mortierella sp. AD032]
MSLNAKVDVDREFDVLMRVLSTLRNAHAVVGDEDRQHESNKIQSMNFENENLARNTKGTYLTYLNLFQDFCDKSYMFEQDSRNIPPGYLDQDTTKASTAASPIASSDGSMYPSTASPARSPIGERIEQSTSPT